MSTTSIDLNSASLEALKALPGVGEGLAKKIIEYREEGNKIDNLSDLSKVQGISARMVKDIESFLNKDEIIETVQEVVDTAVDTTESSVEIVRDTVETLSTEKIGTQIDQLNARIDEMVQQIPGFKESEFSPSKFFTSIQENLDKVTPAILIELREKVLEATPKELAEMEFYQSLWSVVSESFESGSSDLRERVNNRIQPAIESANERFISPAIDSARDRLADAPTLKEQREKLENQAGIKRAVEFINGITLVQKTTEFASTVPGAKVVSTLAETIDTTEPQRFLDGETWETLGNELNSVAKDEWESFQNMLPFTGKAANEEDEIIEVVESA